MFQPVDGEYIEVVPAYGRDYKNKKELIEDILGGRDFQLTTTRQYLNIDNIREHSFRVIVRYGKGMKVADVTGEIYKKKK